METFQIFSLHPPKIITKFIQIISERLFESKCNRAADAADAAELTDDICGCKQK